MNDIIKIEVTAEEAEAYVNATHDAVEEYLDRLEDGSGSLQDLIQINAELVTALADSYDILLATQAVKH